MASTPLSYRPHGVSLVVAVLFRFVWLPLLSGGAIALATGAPAAGIVTGGVLLGVELATYRWRWAWRTLAVLPASGPPAESQGDVRRQAWGYCIGVALIAIGLATWHLSSGATAAKASELAALVLATALAGGGCVGFEHLVRDPRRPRIRSTLGRDDSLNGGGELGLLVLLAPHSLRQGVATLLMIASVLIVGTLGMAGGVAALTIAGTAFEIIVFALSMVGLAPLAGLCVSIVEAHHATTFVQTRGVGDQASPPEA